MAPGDPAPGHGEGVVLYAVFLSSKPVKGPTSAVTDQHAAHLAELDREGSLILAGALLSRFSDTTLAQQHSHDEPWHIGKLRRETP
jgi:uncharacterized protein YciI